MIELNNGKDLGIDYKKIYEAAKQYDVPVNYENTFFKQMADDIKSSYEKRLDEVTSNQQKQIDIANKESKGAKREAIISIIIAVVSLIVSIVAIVVPLISK